MALEKPNMNPIEDAHETILDREQKQKSIDESAATELKKIETAKKRFQSISNLLEDPSKIDDQEKEQLKDNIDTALEEAHALPDTVEEKQDMINQLEGFQVKF